MGVGVGELSFPMLKGKSFGEMKTHVTLNVGKNAPLLVIAG